MSAVPGAAATAAPLLEVVVPAESLFLPPGRQSRPKRVAIVLRGLPGSGKSAAARKLRELELAHGGEAPRVLSLDDYFVTVLARRPLRPIAHCCVSASFRGPKIDVIQTPIVVEFVAQHSNVMNLRFVVDVTIRASVVKPTKRRGARCN